MGALTRAFDWAESRLGPPELWHDSLKTTLGILLTSSQPMFIWWGPDLIQFYNDAYRETMGPERHPSALGQPGRECWQEIWHIIGPQIDSIMAGGPATAHQEQLVPVTRHGRREDVWWTYTYSPIRTGDGVGGVLVICRDVTREHLAKEELRRVNLLLSEEIVGRRHESERLRVLFQQAPGFMVILRGPQHVFDFVNHAYVRLIGQRELLGRTVREALPEVSDQGYFELLDNVYATGKPFFANEVPLSLRRSGDSAMTTVYVDFIYQPIIESDGTVSGIFVEGIDVTERRMAQDALRVSRERLQEGMIAARMAVWEWNLHTGEVTFSDNAPDLFGTEPATLDRPWALVHPDDLAIVENARHRAVAERGEYQAVVRILHGQNREVVWVDVRGKVLCDKAGKPCTIRGVTLDVTQQKIAEVKLQETDRRKDEFLAMLAHELRNPLAPISAAAELLKLTRIEDPRVRQSSAIIARQVSHMTSLVDDLLDVSRVTRGQVALERHVVDMKSLISEAVEQVRPLIEARRHHFTVHQALEPALVQGDRKRLVQVVANLLNNAAKYTPEGGQLHLHLDVAKGRIVIRVRDDGIGIEPQLLPHVFELFTQAKRSADRSQGGLGLGLALVKSLVELHGGDVAVHSGGSAAGSEFVIRLPLHVAQQVVAERHGRDAPQRAASALRIMVVDDNQDAAYVLAMFLEALGHEVLVEHDSSRALERVRAEAPDVCILDIGLPGMDGNELARRLRSSAELRRTALVAITGYGHELDRARSQQAGFDHYLVKPADPERLASLLADLTAVR